jgi:hypothetical protein
MNLAPHVQSVAKVHIILKISKDPKSNQIETQKKHLQNKNGICHRK